MINRLRRLSAVMFSLAALVVLVAQVEAVFAGDNYARLTHADSVVCDLNTGGNILNVDIVNGLLEVIATDAITVQSRIFVNGSLKHEDSSDIPAGTSNSIVPVSFVQVDNVFSYPVDVLYELITYVNGQPVYVSQSDVHCDADGAGTITIFNSVYMPTTITACINNVPADAVQGVLLETALAYYAPNADAVTNITLPIGSHWWVVATQDGFTQLFIACQANLVWVDSALVGTN